MVMNKKIIVDSISSYVLTEEDLVLLQTLSDIMNVGGSVTKCIGVNTVTGDFMLLDEDEGKDIVRSVWFGYNKNDLRVAKTKIVFKNNVMTFNFFGNYWPYASSYTDLRVVISNKMNILKRYLFAKKRRGKFDNMISMPILFHFGPPVDREQRFRDQWENGSLR